jgi:hypothetical protein
MRACGARVSRMGAPAGTDCLQGIQMCAKLRIMPLQASSMVCRDTDLVIWYLIADRGFS